jgi:hypothetical protein
MVLIFLSYFHGYNKNEIFADYSDTWNILNVATFSVTNRSISSTKKKTDFFFTFLPDILITYCKAVTQILGHPVYSRHFYFLLFFPSTNAYRLFTPLNHPNFLVFFQLTNAEQFIKNILPKSDRFTNSQYFRCRPLAL